MENWLIVAAFQSISFVLADADSSPVGDNKDFVPARI